jgi:hypothetical protein
VHRKVKEEERTRGDKQEDSFSKTLALTLLLRRLIIFHCVPAPLRNGGDVQKLVANLLVLFVPLCREAPVVCISP